MKNGQQNYIFLALFAIAMWLLFFRKSEHYCPVCAAAMAA